MFLSFGVFPLIDRNNVNWIVSKTDINEQWPDNGGEGRSSSVLNVERGLVRKVETRRREEVKMIKQKSPISLSLISRTPCFF